MKDSVRQDCTIAIVGIALHVPATPQLVRFLADSFWTGRKIIFLYEVLILGSLAIELYLLSLCLRAAGEYKLTYPEVEEGMYVVPTALYFCSSISPSKAIFSSYMTVRTYV